MGRAPHEWERLLLAQCGSEQSACFSFNERAEVTTGKPGGLRFNDPLLGFSQNKKELLKKKKKERKKSPTNVCFISVPIM